MAKDKKYTFRFGLLFLLAAAFMLIGLGCKGGDKAAREKAKDIKLTYWTVQANKAALQDLANKYQREHPNVKISIKTVNPDKYEQALLEAWADDKGPDIFSLNNLWVRKYLSKIEPMPVATNLPYKIITGTIKKEEKWILRKRNGFTPQTYQSSFVPQAAADAIIKGKIYGVPLAFDSLVLYYNRDIFNIYNIINAPKTWIPFTESVKTITTLDQNEQLVQSAVAMGTADNVNYSVDIASLIMMQNGTKMTDLNSNRVTFNQPLVKAGQKVEPAVQALLFYTDFANFAKEAYTWNKNMDNSLQAFLKGETAMYFGYARDRQKIKAKAPGLNFGIAPFPQIDGSPVKVNFTNYWLETVSKKSKNTEWAWDFLIFAAGQKNSEAYVNKANLPTARLDLLEKQIKKNPDLKIFNEQALTSKSWYRGKQPDVAYEIFKDMIRQINDGQRNQVKKLMDSAVNKINQTL